MTELLPLLDLDTFVSTRHGLHRVAEHVVAKARYVDDGEIRLAATSSGFATRASSIRRRPLFTSTNRCTSTAARQRC